MIDSIIFIVVGFLVLIFSFIGVSGSGFIVAAILICGGSILLKIHKGFLLIQHSIDNLADNLRNVETENEKQG